jgi:rRNA maturation protein Nop10
MASGKAILETKATVARICYDGSAYYESYTLSDWYCPSCGKKSVWEENGEGDYYRGPNFICSSCGGSMCFPEMFDPKDDGEDSRHKQLVKFMPPDRA